MSWQRKWRNGNAPKDRKQGRSIVIVQIILWIGEMESDDTLFFDLLRRMNTMRKSLPTNSSAPLWLHSLKSNGNAFMLILFWGSLRHKLLALKV